MGDERIFALRDVSLDFMEGKIYCLIGTSGSGKSTMLNIIAGLEKPSKGTVMFKNINVEKLNENKLADYRQKYIGFVFQAYNLLGTLTAMENVSLPLVFNKIPKKVRNRESAKMLKLVGLANRRNHLPTELSGGQQQRVSIARAFINKPQVVFADEPTGNLDTKTTFEMMDLITGIVKENKQTLIIVTHDLEIAHYADEIIYMRDGSIERIEKNIGQFDDQKQVALEKVEAEEQSHTSNQKNNEEIGQETENEIQDESIKPKESIEEKK